MRIRNTFIIFIVSGFWHGANWTFIVWGLLNALFIMPSIVFKTNRSHLDIVAADSFLPTWKEFFNMSLTFSLTVFAWIFFRANNIKHAFSYLSQIFSSSLFTFPNFHGIEEVGPLAILLIIFIFLEWTGREQQYAIAQLGSKWGWSVRWMMYYVILLAIYNYGGPEQQFIYFQF